MKLTPLDIKKQEFKRVLRGYDPVEVDTFMDMVAGELEEALRAQKEMRDRGIELETQLRDYRQIEKTLQQTLLQAQETTGRLYDAARKESELIVRDAETRSAAMLEATTAKLLRMEGELQQLSARRDGLLGRLKVLLSSELDLIKTMESDGMAPAPAPSLGTGKDAIALDDVLKSIGHDRTP